ncbi:MAG: 1,4-dihydroxy-2-naphthoate polyprenyltransferase [Actinomycetia bacterium]|nr:1,4-dihydroxy-2-naphthoate polyprenyltransferase [Actinomycetes bacterium]
MTIAKPGSPSEVYLWFAGARLRTLPAAVVPVAVGTASVVADDGTIVLWRFAVTLVLAVAIQIGVNYANDYSDGVQGLDGEARTGPLRLVGSGLIEPSRVKRAALVAFGVAVGCGLVLAFATSLWMLAVGVACLWGAWNYTGGSSPYGYRGFGEVAVFVFFGLVATVGSAFVHHERFTLLAVALSVPVGLLAVALLVVNNLRDIPEDEANGKLTLAVRIGDPRTRQLFVALFVVAALVVAVIGITQIEVALGLIGFLAAIVPIRLVLGGAEGRDLVAALAGTGRVQIAVGALLTVGLVLAGG